MVMADQDKDTLLKIAQQSIEYGLNADDILEVKPEDFTPALREERATFVSLHLKGRLRGCIGVLEACRPLVVDVAHTAFAAAFMDRRFPPLKAAELKDLEIDISILTPLEPLSCTTEQELIRIIRPGTDGLLLEDKGSRGAFLPVMWKEIPQPEEFLRHLKVKAGLPTNYWSNTIKVSRFTAEMVP